MILMLVIGMVVGGVFVGAITRRSLAPVSSPPTPTVAANALSASVVYVVLDTKGDTISCVGPDNHPMLIHTTTLTTFQREGVAASFDDITVGTRLNVRGKVATDGSIYADRIGILDSALSGQITAIVGNTLSITTKDNTATVAISSKTAILDAKTRQAVKQSALAPGQTVQVYGALNPSGQFNALLVFVQG